MTEAPETRTADPITTWQPERDVPVADALEQAADASEPALLPVSDDPSAQQPATPQVSREPWAGGALSHVDDGDLIEQSLEVPLDDEDGRD